jgi:3-hydroxybutyryl-CoA dehydrogenase
MMTVGVVGAGTMGNGIAQVFAQSGHRVRLSDIRQEFLDRGIGTIENSLDRLIQKGSIAKADQAGILGRIQTCIGTGALSDCGLIVEAATENLAVKSSIFSELDSICPAATIFASIL